MRERTEQILKIVCVVLLALLVVQLVKASFRVNPLRGVTIPELPILAGETNDAPESATNVAAAAGKGTNQVSMATNALASGGTNAVAKQGGATNAVAAGEENAASNSPAQVGTKGLSTNFHEVADADVATNAVVEAKGGTNAEPAQVSKTNRVEVAALVGAANTNAAPLAAIAGTNLSVSQTNSGANAVALAAAKMKATNSHVPPQMAMHGGPPGMHGRPGMHGGGPAPELEPEVKARVLKVYESELLGRVIRPQPMALMGIAGNTAFLRSPNGQTGLVKEGDSLGEIKLLRIGINRVLVEEAGQKKELTIFQGYGGKSLLEKEDSNENARTKN